MELFSAKVCEMIVNKHTETTEYVRNQSTFQEKYNIYRYKTREDFKLRMRNFHGIILI